MYFQLEVEANSIISVNSVNKKQLKDGSRSDCKGQRQLVILLLGLDSTLLLRLVVT